MLCDCFVQDVAEDVQHSEPAQKDKREWTALHHAAYNNLVHDVETLLMQNPANMFTKSDGDTALSLAVENGSVESFLCFMKYRIAESVMTSMLYVAIKYGQLGIVDAIVPYCGNVQLCDALVHATTLGHTSIVRSLSRFIPSDFIVDKDDKQTLLHIAAMQNKLDVLQYLCSICSSDVIVAKDKHGDTVLSCAIRMSSFGLVKFLVHTCPQLLYITNDANWNVLMQSQIVKNYQVTYYLLDRYSLFTHLKTNERLTPLHLASCIHIATRLHAIDPTMIDVVTTGGNTVLHSALNTKHLPLIEYLFTLRPCCYLGKKCVGRHPICLGIADTFRQNSQKIHGIDAQFGRCGLTW